MRKKKEQLSKQDQEETLKKLYTAASAIKSQKRMEQFLKEILTDSEQLMLGRRVWIAQMLLSGYLQDEICEKLECSPSTVRRISKWLNTKLPGYGEAVSSRGRRTKVSEQIDPTSFKALRKKYPMHFLFFNVAEAIVSSYKQK